MVRVPQSFQIKRNVASTTGFETLIAIINGGG